MAWVPQALDTSPGQRYRIEQWDPLLRAKGIEISYFPFADEDLAGVLQQQGHIVVKARGLARALANRLRSVRDARQYDLVYLFREGALLGPALAERLLARTGVPYVFDFDDAIWIRYVSPANAYFSYLRFPGKTAAVCRLARSVIVGNSYLEGYAHRYNSRVTVVPSTIDTARYRPVQPVPKRMPVVGWTGSYSTVQYLALVRPALERLRRRRAFRVVVVGGKGFTADGVEVEQRPWRSATEPEDLADFDVGIMPLPDSEWERGKCGLKILQYMALGIPAVASPVGANSRIIADGRNGFLAASEGAWERILDSLLGDPDLRLTVGAAGRDTVESEYSAAVHAPRVARVLEEAAS